MSKNAIRRIVFYFVGWLIVCLGVIQLGQLAIGVMMSDYSVGETAVGAILVYFVLPASLIYLIVISLVERRRRQGT